MAVRVAAVDHVQLTMPPDREADAEAFYFDVLGFAVLPEPEPLASRGGRWFVCGDVQVHLGVESDFRPARKAHPALRVDGYDDLVKKPDETGASWRWDRDLPGVGRSHVDDHLGVELPRQVDAGGISGMAAPWLGGYRCERRAILS
jgi:hypothetical protein